MTIKDLNPLLFKLFMIKRRLKKELTDFLKFVSKNKLFNQEIYLGARPTGDKNVCPESVIYKMSVPLIEKIKSMQEKGICQDKCKIYYLLDKSDFLDYLLVKKD